MHAYTIHRVCITDYIYLIWLNLFMEYSLIVYFITIHYSMHLIINTELLSNRRLYNRDVQSICLCIEYSTQLKIHYLIHHNLLIINPIYYNDCIVIYIYIYIYIY